MTLLSRFRRARREPSSQSAGRPCGCPSDPCSQAKAIIVRVYRGRRIGHQWGEWADCQQALVELGIHWDRDPSECWAMLEHPVSQS